MQEKVAGSFNAHQDIHAITQWKLSALKGQSNEIFDLQFCSLFDPPEPLTNGLKYFRFFKKNSPSYSNFSISTGYHTPASQSHKSFIPLWVNNKSAKTWLPGVSYPGESFFLNLKIESVSEILTKIENIFTRWSASQADSNNEKRR